MANAAAEEVALKVVMRLRDAGHQALFAGGCVRDMLLGCASADYDVATSATPRQVKRLFPHVLLIGEKFGVAMVIEERKQVEVATFRSDLGYSDGRRPDGVEFSSPAEDAHRRDFTINGMFYDPISCEVIDYVGGREDIERRVIRTIGEADERFSEDYLRMIRAVRFAIRLDFSMTEDVVEGIRRNADRIVDISGERICDEISKMLGADSSQEAMQMLADLKLAGHILPELFKHDGQWAAAMARLATVAGRQDVLLSLAAMFVGAGSRAVGKIVRRWGASNEIKRSLCWMSDHLHDWQTATDMAMCDFKRLLACEDFDRLGILWRYEETLAAGSSVKSDAILQRAAGIAADQISPPPFIDGEELKVMGLKEGRELGVILRCVYDSQLNEEITSKEQAGELARKLMDEAKKS